MNSNKQRQLTLYGERRSGRTSLAVSWAIMNLSAGKKGLWVAPTYAQAEVGMRMLQSSVDPATITHWPIRTSMTMRFENGAELQFLVPRPDLAKGRFVDFVVVDDADEFGFDERFEWLMTQQYAQFLWIKETK